MNEKAFMHQYSVSKLAPVLTELRALKGCILEKEKTLKFLVSQLKALNDAYIKIFLRVFNEPGWLTAEQYKFHFENFFLMHVFVADEFVFLKCGRMVHLNKKNTVPTKFHCSTRTDWFNRDYECDKRVALSECSFEGYTYRFSVLLNPIGKAAALVPKVICNVHVKQLI
jgi:hypothetical protein